MVLIAKVWNVAIPAQVREQLLPLLERALQHHCKDRPNYNEMARFIFLVALIVFAPDTARDIDARGQVAVGRLDVPVYSVFDDARIVAFRKLVEEAPR
jgi:hypothetical protein